MKAAIQALILIVILLFAAYLILSYMNNDKNLIITEQNYNNIYAIIDNSSEFTPHEKSKLKIYIKLYGEKCIGYSLGELLNDSF